VIVFLDGGFDSFNMIVPNCDPLKSQYESKRGELSLSSEKKTPITVTGQPCEKFSIHSNLDSLVKSYNDGNTLFLLNTGVLNTAVNRDNYWELTKTELFGHNTMNEETQKIDPYLKNAGTGVMGRMLDVLSRMSEEDEGPFNVGAISIEIASSSLEGKAGNAPIIVSSSGTKKFDPKPWSDFDKWQDTDLFPSIQKFNGLTTLDSSIYADYYSSSFLRVIAQSDILDTALKNAQLTESFDASYFSEQLAQVAKLIKTVDERGVDREVFFVNHCCWDHHSNLQTELDEMFLELNGGLDSFWKEMKAQGRENDVILMGVSEFGRTLTPNSSKGSDHAW